MTVNYNLTTQTARLASIKAQMSQALQRLGYTENATKDFTKYAAKIASQGISVDAQITASSLNLSAAGKSLKTAIIEMISETNTEMQASYYTANNLQDKSVLFALNKPIQGASLAYAFASPVLMYIDTEQTFIDAARTTTNIKGMFYNTRCLTEAVTIDNDIFTNAESLCSNSSIPAITFADSSKCANFRSTFNASKIQTINNIDFSSDVTGAWNMLAACSTVSEINLSQNSIIRYNGVNDTTTIQPLFCCSSSNVSIENQLEWVNHLYNWNTNPLNLTDLTTTKLNLHKMLGWKVTGTISNPSQHAYWTRLSSAQQAQVEAICLERGWTA